MNKKGCSYQRKILNAYLDKVNHDIREHNSYKRIKDNISKEERLA